MNTTNTRTTLPPGDRHLDAELLQAMATGIALDDDLARAEKHLASCRACAGEVALLRADIDAIRDDIRSYVAAARPSRRRDWSEISVAVVPPDGGWRRLVFRLAAGGLGGVALSVLLTVGLTAATVAVVTSPTARRVIETIMPSEPTPVISPTATPISNSGRPSKALPAPVNVPSAPEMAPGAAEPVPSGGRSEREKALSVDAPRAVAPTSVPVAATGVVNQPVAPIVAATPSPTALGQYIGSGTIEADRPPRPGPGEGTPEPPPGDPGPGDRRRGPGPGPGEGTHEPPPGEPDPHETPGAPRPTPDRPPGGGGGGGGPRGGGGGPRGGGPPPATPTLPLPTATMPGLAGGTAAVP